MWLRAPPSQHAADAVHPTPATCNTQVKVVASRSCSAGLVSARQVQRGCVSTVVGRCQQGYDVSASAAHSHDEPAAPISSGVQVPQMLHLQPAPALTAAVDLQQPRQQVQYTQPYHHQQQQRPDSHLGPLHWFSNGHSSEHGIQRQPDQVQQCFLADHSALPQQPSGGQHFHDHSVLQHHMPVGDGGQQQQQQGVPTGTPALPNNEPPPQEVQQQQQQEQQEQQQRHGRPLAAFDAQRALPKHLRPAQKQQRELPLRKAPERRLPQQQHEHQDRQQQLQQPEHEDRQQQRRQQQHQERQQQAPAQFLHSQQPQSQQPQPQLQLPPQPPPVQPVAPEQPQQQPELHPAQISRRIKQRTSLQALQYLHQQHSSSFNTFNMSGLMVRLAHIHQAQLDERLQLAAAGQLALQVMQQLVPRLAECQSARQAANAIWALAALQCEVPQGLLQSAAQQLGAQQAQLLQASTPQDIANLAWGLAKLQYNPACSLWLHVVAAAQRQVAGLKPGELAMLLWALADTQQRLQQQRRHQQQQQQQQRLQQLQLRRQQQAAQSGGSNASMQQPVGELRWPSLEHAVSVQYAARRQSHAEASTSAAATIKAAYIAAKRAGSSSGSSRSGIPRKLAQPVWPASRTRSGNQQSSNSSSSSAGAPNAGSGGYRGVSSSTAGAVHGRADAPLEQHLQQLLPSVADVVITQLARGQQQYQAKESAMLLWACGVLGCQHEGLLTVLAGHQQQQLRGGRSNSQDVANSVWALGKLQVPQPQLLAAAVDQPTWLHSSSRHELSQVLYGTAAVIRQQRLQQADSSDLLPAVALWQATAAQVLAGGDLQGLVVAEAATILQAAALMLEPVRQPSRRWRQQQQQQQRQQEHQQQQQDQETGDSSALTASTLVAVSPLSTMSSISSMCSMTCSMDSFDEAAVAAPGQARQLMSAIDAELCSQAEAGQLRLPLSGQHVAAMLHSLAAAGVRPSTSLQQMLLNAAAAAAPSMDTQELALTAWSAAKLFSGSRSSSSVQGLMEAVDRAAGPLLPAMNPQDLSMLAWAHGKLWDLGDSLFMHQLAQAALQQVPQFGPQALSNLTWAFAQLRHYDAALTGAVGRRARVLLGQFTPAELSNLTWALTTLGHRHSGLLRAIGNQAVGQCSSWDSKACAKLIISYCSRGMRTHRYRSMLGTLADALVAKSARSWSRLTPHELVQLAVALAVGRVRHRACTVQIATVALAWLPRIALYEVVSLVWALAMIGQPHEALLQAVSARVASELQAGPSMQHLQLLQQQQQQGGAASQQQLSAAAAAAGELPVDVAAQQLLHYVQEQQQASAGGQDDGVLVQHDGSSPSSSGSSSSSSDGSSPLWSVPIYAVIGSRLFAPQLARLAWSYKTFAHPDAGWYLAAGQLLASAWEPPSSSSSRLLSSAHSNGTTPVGNSAASSSSSSSSSGHSSRAGVEASGISSTASGRHGVAASGGRSGSDGLQRPVRRPVPAPAATPEHRQGQQ